MSSSKVKCTCGWSWNKSDSSKKDMYICHECGRDNSNNMKNGGWLDNYNDSEVSLPEGYVGEGYDTSGRDYSPAWGGQFQMGGSIPGSVGFTYARTNSPAPSNGKYAKKTMASAQNGTVKESTSVNRDRRIPSVKDVIKKVPGTKVYKDVYGNLLEKDDKGVYKPRQKEKEEVRKHVPQSKLSKAKEIALNPMTAAGYKVRNEDIPENFSRSEDTRNNLDTAVDFINPAWYAESAKNFVQNQGQVFSDVSEGNFQDAGINQLMAGVEALNFIPLAKGAKPLLNKGIQRLGNIKTSISPELRQGLRTNGPSFGSKIKPTFPEGYNLTPDESGNRYWLNNNNKQVGQVEYMSPTVDTQGRNWGSINIEIDPRHRGKGLSAPMYQQMLDHAEQQGHYGIMSIDGSLQSPTQSKAIRKYFNGKYSEDSNLLKNVNETIDENNKFIQEENIRWGENEPMDPYESNVYLMSNKNKFKQGGIIKDDLGQWAHPGEITEIGSNQITMQGVPYPVLGVSDEGDVQMMYPEEEYKFKGKKVTEFPMAKNGIRQEQKGLVNLDQLTNFTNYNTKQPGGWMDKYQ